MSAPHLVVVFRGLGGVSQALPDAPPVIPPDESDALIHWELDEASGATADNIGTLGAAADGTIVGTVDYGLPSLINGVSTASLGIGPDGRVQRAHVAGLAVASATIALRFQADSLPAVGGNTVLVAKDWIAEPGGISMEVYNDAGVLRARADHRSAAGTAQWVGASTGVGTIPLHTGALLILRIINGAETSLWLRTAGQAMVKVAQIASGAGLASNDLPLRVGCYLTEPLGAATDVGFFIGLLKRFQFWGRALTDVEIAALPAPVSAVTFDAFSAGALTDNTTGSISIPGATRPASGYVCKINSQPANGTVISESGGTTWNYDTNAATTGADSFTGHIEAGGSSSPVAAISLSVGAAPAGITLAAMNAFTPSRQQVTALAGWPAGRTPKQVSVQSGLCHGYVRRGWKLTNNDGTWMDFQPGWRKGTGKITIVLDNDTLLDLNFTINHSIPAPGSGGVTRTLDKLGGANFTTWTAAIAGCAANDVLVVRARAGGEVYPVDVQQGGAVSTVNGVKVVAHPDDLAAGRRPRVHVQGTVFARYADDLNAGHWEVHQALGGVHGTVYRTVQVVGTNKVNVGVAYRARSGRIKHTYVYRDAIGGLSRLTDTTYPRVAAQEGGSGTDDPGAWSQLYMGPGHYLHTDGRIYIRLSGVTSQVGAKQVNPGAGVGSNPPWDWSDDFPTSENPNTIPLYISSTNQQTDGRGSASTTISYCLRINGRSNWLLENIDLVSGGSTIECRPSNNVTLRGCRVLGWAPPNVVAKDTDQGTYERTHNMFDAHDCLDLLCDRCEFWGGQTPWYSYAENKAWEGGYGASMKANLFEIGANDEDFSGRFLNCVIDGFPTATRQAGHPLYVKFHQCDLRLWGIDGALCCETPQDLLEYVRCRLFEATLRGYVDGADRGVLNLGYCLITNFRPVGHKRGWWSTSDTPNNNHFMCNNQCIGHGIGGDARIHRYYSCTAIGAHHHITAAIQKTTDGGSTNTGATRDGAGAWLFPNTRNHQVTEFMTRNNILAVRPNGSLGGSPTPHGPGRDSHVAVILHSTHIGHMQGAAVTYSMDYNLYHRGAGMPTISGQSNTVFTTIASGGGEAATNAIADVRSTTGQENNGRVADPLFVGVWDAGKLDRELHTTAFWCLQAGSPATTGGDGTNRSWRDLDFGVETTYGGNTWLGCMDPLASAVEQQVGPLGPMPSDL